MFDTQRFLEDHYKTPDGIVGTFNAYRLDIPPRDTVRKWFARGSIPSEWFPMLVAVRELDTGEPIRLAPYLTKGV